VYYTDKYTSLQSKIIKKIVEIKILYHVSKFDAESAELAAKG
jgi:hypothetical protein